MAKFLIIRFSSIGDIVLTSPVVRCLKEQVADAEIHYLTKIEYQTMFFKNPYITKVHFLTKDNFKELIEKLRKENYDFIIDLHKNLRTSIVKKQLRVKSYSFKKLNFRKWVKVYTKINILPDKHIVERYLDTLKAFNVYNDDKGLEYFIPFGNEMYEKEFPKGFLDNYMVIAVGAGHGTKTIPPETLEEVCEKSMFPIMLIGSAYDRRTANRIVKNVKGNIINGCGVYNINESAELINNAKIIVAADTGMMHIAAAFKKPLISVWGNTIPEFGMYPYRPGDNSHILQVDKLWCRPCSKIGFDECPLGHFKCMNSISADSIVGHVNLLYKQIETKKQEEYDLYHR